MKHKLYTILCLAVIICGLCRTDTLAFGADTADDIITGRLESAYCKTEQQWLDGQLTDGAGETSEWYIFSLTACRADLDYTAYTRALEKYLSDNPSAGAVARQRCALALIACGKGSTPPVSAVASQTIGKQGIMSRVFGLHLLNNGVECEVSADAVINELLSAQHEDGGWGLSDASDIDVTAMVLQALAPHRFTDAVGAAVRSAVDFLSQNQLPDGGYKSYNAENPESAAQVLIALSALGINPDDPRFVKDAAIAASVEKYRVNGGFSHTEGGPVSDIATAQILAAAVAVHLAKNGLDPFFIYTDTAPVPTAGADATAPAPSATVPSPVPTVVSSAPIGYKAWTVAGILAVALCVCIILLILKKRKLGNFILVLLLCAVGVSAVLLTDITTSDEYYGGTPAKGKTIGSVTVSVRCDTVSGKADYIPSDGIIISSDKTDIDDDDTVFDVLIETARKNGIQVESRGTGSMAYIEGINYLYELDFGDLSGWIYRVNGVVPSTACGAYRLNDGDIVEWLYTVNMADDLGSPLSGGVS